MEGSSSDELSRTVSDSSFNSSAYSAPSSSTNSKLTEKVDAYSSNFEGTSRESTYISGSEHSNSRSDISDGLRVTSTGRENIPRESTAVDLKQASIELSIGTSRESTINGASYSHDVNTSGSQNETVEDDLNGIEKEKSVLIERDGKFELVDPSEVEADAMDTSSISKEIKVKERESKSPQRPRSNTRNKNPDYAHVTSAYALTETQVEMKKRRISVRTMRINEEKQRRREEEEKQRLENQKSFDKWILQKSSSSQKKHKSEAEKGMDEERRRIAEKSYNQWLKQKEMQQKLERKMEKVRLADEAEHYIVRDRVMCEKSFRQWLKQKNVQDNKDKMPKIEKNKSSASVPKQKTATHERRVQSSRSRSAIKSVSREQKKQPLNKLGEKMAKIERMSKIRYCETSGYQHPASYDDLLL